MLKVLIDCDEHPAIFDLPYKITEVGDYLCSAGYWNPDTDLQLLDDDNPHNVQVKLIAENAADNHLQSIFPEDARLSTVNTVCDLFYRLPAEKQDMLIGDIDRGEIVGLQGFMNVLKDMNTAQAHSLPAIIFSRVKLYTDTEDSCEFFMGGVPESDEDFEDHPDFVDFVEQISITDAKEITAYITTFTEGNGDPVPAEKADIERIYNAIADVDLDTITGWNKTGEDSFTFDYDINELFNMNGIE